MAIVWMDGFNNSGNNIHNGRIYEIFTGGFSLTTGRYDGGLTTISSTTSESVRLQSGIHKSIPNSTTVTMGVALSGTNANNSQINSGNTAPLGMMYNVAPGVTPSQNSMIAGWSISSAASPSTADFSINIINRLGNVLTVNIPFYQSFAWNFVELEVTTGVSTGSARVYLNGKLMGSVSGVNFSTSTSVVNINRVALLSSNVTSGASNNVQYDDFYITDTYSRLGEIHISTIRPSADTAQKDWTPSTGSTNFSIVAFNNYENPNYITTNDHNKKDIYDLSNLSTLSLQTNSLILATRTTGAGYKLFFGESNVNLLIKSGSTEFNGAGLDLYEGSTAIFPLPPIINETNPDTAIAWTITDINNLQIGIKTN